MAWMHLNRAVLGGFKARAEGEVMAKPQIDVHLNDARNRGIVFRALETTYDLVHKFGEYNLWPLYRRLEMERLFGPGVDWRVGK